MTNITITQELVKFLFDYKDGFLYYKNKSSRYNTKPIGSLAGYVRTLNSGDRMITKVNGKDYISSRIIFLWHQGYMPEIVDHVDFNQLNDKIDNLRAATKSQNNKYSTSRKGSTSIYLGVCTPRKNPCNYWFANIWVNNRSLKLGKFDTQEEAALAYNRAAVKYHGEFANLNIVKPYIFLFNIYKIKKPCNLIHGF